MRLISRIGQWFDRRLQLAAPIRDIAEHPVPRSTASWWYVFGSAALVVLILQVVTGILLALCYVPSAAEAWNSLQTSESRCGAGMVHPRAARLGLELHGRHRAHPHGAGVSVRRIQVSPRAHLDRRRFPSADDARHGIHRAGLALRSGRVLGTGHWGVDCEPCPVSPVLPSSS